MNDAPVASGGTLTTAEDTVFTGTLPVATDIDGDALAYAAGTLGPLHGTVMINANGTYSYTPAANYTGTDSFSFTVTDGTITAERTISVTVTPVNDAPVVAGGTASVAEEQPLNGNLPGASDVDGDALTYGTGTTAPAHGTVTINADGGYTYTPAPNYTGTDTFSFTVTDGTVTVERTITVTVTPVNDAPVASAPPVVATEDTPVSGTITVADVDGGTPTFTLTTAPALGTVAFNPDGTYTYTPNPNATGSDSFAVQVSDGVGGVFSVTIPVTITPVNDAPIISALPVSTEQNEAVSGRIMAADADGDPLVFTPLVAPAKGTVTINADGSYTYTPMAGAWGDDSFTVLVSDGQGGTVRVTIPVTITEVPVSVFVSQTSGPPGTVLAVDTPVMNDGLRTIAATGVIVETVNAISTLNGTYLPIDAPHPLTTVVNDIAFLGGGATIPSEGRVLTPGILGLQHRSTDAPGSALGLAGSGHIHEQTRQGFDRVLGMESIQLTTSAWINVVSAVSNGILNFSVKGNGIVSADICRDWIDVTRRDGTALPDWLQHVREGEFVAIPPEGIAVIDLRLVIRLESGMGVVRDVTLDLRTGAITDHTGGELSRAAPPLFSDQIRAAGPHPANGTDADMMRSIL